MKKYLIVLLILLLFPLYAVAQPSIGGGPISGNAYMPGGTDVAIADGGTGASTAAGARTNLGLGTIATQDANNVAVTGGAITGITDVAVADGGTGASTATAARANLGVNIYSVSFPIYNANAAIDDFLIDRVPFDVTITHIYGVLQSGTNVVGGVDICDSNGANCVAVDSDITFDGGLDQDDGSLTNPTINSGNWTKWHTTSVSSPGYLTVTVEGTF